MHRNFTRINRVADGLGYLISGFADVSFPDEISGPLLSDLHHRIEVKFFLIRETVCVFTFPNAEK